MRLALSSLPYPTRTSTFPTTVRADLKMPRKETAILVSVGSFLVTYVVPFPDGFSSHVVFIRSFVIPFMNEHLLFLSTQKVLLLPNKRKKMATRLFSLEQTYLLLVLWCGCMVLVSIDCPISYFIIFFFATLTLHYDILTHVVQYLNFKIGLHATSHFVTGANKHKLN